MEISVFNLFVSACEMLLVGRSWKNIRSDNSSPKMIYLFSAIFYSTDTNPYLDLVVFKGFRWRFGMIIELNNIPV